MSVPTPMPSFCAPHWDLLRVHQPDKMLAVAAVRAIQLGSQKLADEEGWNASNPHSVTDAMVYVGPCWVCYFGVGFLNELDDFIDSPPAWANGARQNTTPSEPARSEPSA